MAHLVALLIDLPQMRRQAEGAKDLEIVVLRHQLRRLERRRPRLRPAHREWLPLGPLATKLRRVTAGARGRWSRGLVLATPKTVLR